MCCFVTGVDNKQRHTGTVESIATVQTCIIIIIITTTIIITLKKERTRDLDEYTICIKFKCTIYDHHCQRKEQRFGHYGCIMRPVGPHDARASQMCLI